ncbi:Aldo/keto reductase family [Gilliamella apicola SCGC AB-598-I20]|nr:Aldo/keto reductase family [Gilliamella apicola SCGC AB-598-I20]
MIIEVESYCGNTLISGKVRNIGQLKNRMMKIIKEFGTDNFVDFFCVQFGFNVYPYDEYIIADYVIDLDTYQVYKPTY